MKPKLMQFVFCTMLIFVLHIMPTAAQNNPLNATFVSDDGTFEISYPASWLVDNTDPAFVALSGSYAGYQLSISAFSTQMVVPYATGETSAFDVAVNLSDAPLIEADAAPLVIGERDAAVASVEIEEYAGVAFIIEMLNGQYGMVIAVSTRDGLEVNRELILNIVESYNTPLDSIQGALLTRYADDWEVAVAELQEEGIISAGGSLVFEEDQAFFTGQGFVFTPLGRRFPHTNIVMAADLEFTSENSREYEDCSLLARVVNADGEAITTYLQVGIDNSQDVFYYDSQGTESTTAYELVPLNLDLDEPHHLLFIVANEFLTVYVDGQRVFHEVQINPPREGTYGIALLGRDAESRCEGYNIWVYQFPVAAPVECLVTSAGEINKRSGPGTNFAVVGLLSPEDNVRAVAQSTAEDGFIWWQLNDDSWVREDIVIVTGDCETVPEAPE